MLNLLGFRSLNVNCIVLFVASSVVWLYFWCYVIFGMLKYINVFICWPSLDLSPPICHFSVFSLIHLTHLCDSLFKMKLISVWMLLGLFDCCDEPHVGFKVLCLFFFRAELKRIVIDRYMFSYYWNVRSWFYIWFY